MSRLNVKVRWSLGGIKLVIYEVNGFFVIWHRETTDSSKVYKVDYLVPRKEVNPWHTIIWMRILSKRIFGATIC